MSVAARNSADSEEFQQYKESLRGAGMGSTMEDVFRSLGRRLPGWVLPAAAGAEATGATVTATAQAMQRIVTLEQDPREAARRFQELVQAAIEQHNQGSLARAVTMLDLAASCSPRRRWTRRTSRRSASRPTRSSTLSVCASSPRTPDRIRFSSGCSGRSQPSNRTACCARSRPRRSASTAACCWRCSRSTAPRRAPSPPSGSRRRSTSFGDRDAHFQRNLLHILRRIPRPDDVAIDIELQTAIRLSALGHPAILAKEAITYLGQSRDERAERALIARVAEYEGALAKPGAAGSDPAEVVAVLDRAVFALARLGTPAAVRAVVNHGLKRLPQLGNTTARLAALAGVDLSGDTEVVERLVEAIRGELPHRIFGFLLKKDDNLLLPLIEAVSSTSSPAVKNVLADIVQRFPGEGFAQAAAKVLAGTDVSGPQAPSTPSAPSASLSGDLELFGLPTLLQNLSQSGTSGTLMISDPVGEEIATVDLEGGKFRSCRAGPLHDEVALFQLIERPTPASFTFLSRPESAPPSDPKLLRDLVPLFFEGTRRYDEFQQACALIPDYACLRATGTTPTPPPEEDDQALMRTLWQRTGSGAPALECEAGLAVDSYRARRILAHWVEEGSLEPK